MGQFDLIVDGRHQRISNHLMWRAHSLLLRRVLPTQSGTLTYTIGFSCPMCTGDSGAPEYGRGWSFTFDRKGEWDDYVGDNGIEGASPNSDVRTLFGYERAAVTWTVTQHPSCVKIDTGWHQWVNDFSWAEKGSEGGSYNGPTLNCNKPGEYNHGYPWCFPTIHTDYEDYEDVMYLEGMQGIGGYPIGCCFVTINDQILAAAEVRENTWWRPGGYINMRYTAGII